MPDRKDLIILAILIIIGIGMAKLFYMGANLSFDDAAYLTYAHQMLNGTYHLQESPYSYGVGFVATVAIGLWLTHGQLWGASLPQIIEYLALIVIIFYCLKAYFDRDVAFTIALGAEASGFIMLYSTRVLPDMLLGVLVASVFLIWAYKGTEKKWMFLAGFISGITVFVKLGGYILLLLLAIGEFWIITIIGTAIALIILLALKDEKRIYFVGGLFVAILIFQALLPNGLNILSLASRYDINQVALSQATLINNLVIMPLMLFGIVPAHYFSVSPEAVKSQIYPIGILGILALLGILCLKWGKDKRLVGIAAILIISLLYLFIGTESLIHWVYITVVSRYFIEFVVPIALLATLPVQTLINTRLGNKYRILILIGILVLIIASNWTIYGLFYGHPQINYALIPTNTLSS